MDKVDRKGADECWPWKAARNPHGYGTFRGGDGEQLAHRYGWRMVHGQIPEGMVVCHSCDNPQCQNPAHWFIGTPRDNNDDKMRKGRHVAGMAPGERNGNASLTATVVAQIIALAESGQTQKQIGQAVGTSQRTVGKILRGERWATVTGGEARSTPLRRVRGESHHNAKLTQAEADEIRARYRSGRVSQQAIADEYGIAQRTVSQIVRDLAWVK